MFEVGLKKSRLGHWLLALAFSFAFALAVLLGGHPPIAPEAANTNTNSSVIVVADGGVSMPPGNG